MVLSGFLDMLSVEYIFINISFGYISSSGIVGSCGNFISHFKKLPNYFRKWY